MRRPVAIIVAVLGAALLLSACKLEIVDPFTPPDTRAEVVAGSVGTPGIVSIGTLNAGETAFVEVTMPTELTSSDLLRVELDRNLELQLLNSRLGLIVLSRSATHFAASSTSLLGGPYSIGTQAVDPREPCAASCVQIEPDSSRTYYARITNQSGVPTDVSVRAVVDIYGDEHEREGNDRPVSAISFPQGTSTADSGAIETAGDVDFWFMEATGNVFFDATGGVGVEATKVDNNGNSVGPVYVDGDVIPVSRGQILKVFSPSGRAGVAAANASLYYLELD